jgi:hypothetical protein
MTDAEPVPSTLQSPICSGPCPAGTSDSALAAIVAVRTVVAGAFRRFIHDRRMLPVATPRLLGMNDGDRDD